MILVDMSEQDEPALGKRWDPDAAMKALESERTIMDVNMDDPIQVRDAVNRIFRENAMAAAMSICHAALHEPNARVRLSAAESVVKLATTVTVEGETDPLVQLLHEVYGHLDANS